MRKVMISLMALVLSGAFATAMQAQRPERPVQRPGTGMMNGERPHPKKGGKRGMQLQGMNQQHNSDMKGMAGQGQRHGMKGMAGQSGQRMDKGQRPAGGGMRPGGMGQMAQ